MQTSECCSLPAFDERYAPLAWLCVHSSYTCADKTIKLWKVFERSLKVVSESNHHDGQRQIIPPVKPAFLKLPKMAAQDNIVTAVPRKVYSNAHAYHINSISINSDGETYVSADDLRINLWNMNISDQSFSKRPRLLLTRRLLIFCRYRRHQTG